MTALSSARHSFKARITIATLTIFVVGIWSLAFYVSRMLHADMVRVSGEQQFSTASFIAADINSQLIERQKALEAIAAQLSPAMLGNTAALQALIEQRPILPLLFNAGTFVTGADGIAIASLPISLGRVGVNYSDRDFIVAALKEGKSTVGRPVVGKQMRSPIFGMAVPIRDAQGKVIGVLAGVTDLGKPSFLHKVTDHRYGNTGGYVLVARQFRLVVTATDKSRIMESLPAIGTNVWVDRFAQGYEGSAVSPNPRGVEMLVSGKAVPVAGWYLLVVLPTAEAFAPLQDMLQRLLLATLVVTLLAGALTWWMLRRQLAPMLATTKALATLSATNQPSQLLAITTQDEIGDLVKGFNGLLAAIKLRDDSLQEAQRIAHMGSWHLDVATNQVVWSIELYRMYGFDPALPVPPYTEHQKLFTPDSWETLATALENTRVTGIPYELELKTVRKDGSNGWMWVRGEQVRDENGVVVGLRGVAQDITERKKAEEATQAASQYARSLIEASLDPLVTISAEGKVKDVNKATEEVTGVSRSRLIGSDFADYFTDPQKAREGYQQVFSQGAVTDYPLAIRHTSGKVTDVLYNASVYRDTQGNVLGVFAAARDITERKQIEDELIQYRNHLEELVSTRTSELEQSRDDAEAANRAKTMFLANMSHELRTPMNGVMGMTDLALRRATDPKQIDWLNKSKGAAQRMINVVNDILDFSKAEAERLPLDEKNFSLSQLVDDAIVMQTVVAETKGLNLTREIPATFPDQLSGDAFRLRQILLNFLGNACKFSDQGTITVRTGVVVR